MKLNNLTPAKGSTKREKRIGRGEGSGHGGQSTRGMNGAKSRSGYSRKIGFEGGQMPIQRRLPKFGFHNPTRVEYKAVNLSTLQSLSEKRGLTVITFDNLIEAGLVSKNDKVKILGNGELTVKLEVTADAFSKTAIAKIEALEGKAIIL
ncbi:MAG: 50S ribosomal protein L15 [Bacteroidales bacterium]|jgi:large subunit ribosomal protein L15|nr:50S ribosomal protein L15 [Bacteroidales bacterium]MBO7283954.1 50S ribosomal protein L15 [Bacteroidales bacterium]MBO7323113.1 50S ribosomal protein L15 [Bacteroidales bacterium]MBQ5747820.1 50S ribosomal protein L15 [Bacteroidales bacterium]MBQ5881825.1 50S ribosomal protein L15 [Bacteroidales bacterium]